MWFERTYTFKCRCDGRLEAVDLLPRKWRDSRRLKYVIKPHTHTRARGRHMLI